MQAMMEGQERERREPRMSRSALRNPPRAASKLPMDFNLQQRVSPPINHAHDVSTRSQTQLRHAGHRECFAPSRWG